MIDSLKEDSVEVALGVLGITGELYPLTLIHRPGGFDEQYHTCFNKFHSASFL